MDPGTAHHSDHFQQVEHVLSVVITDPELYLHWKTDPLGLLEQKGVQLGKMDDRIRRAATYALTSLVMPKPEKTLTVAGIACPLCKAAVISATTAVVLGILSSLIAVFTTGVGEEGAAVSAAAAADDAAMADLAAMIAERSPAWLTTLARAVGKDPAPVAGWVVAAFRASCEWAEGHGVVACFGGPFVAEFLDDLGEQCCKGMGACD